jgi:hypothetical protein
MRWRGPPDLAVPDTAISCSASVPLDQPPSRTPARSPSCPVPLASRGAPRMVPVFSGESISTPFARGRTRGYGQQFQDLLIIHKLSTVQLKLSPCRPGFSTGSPQTGPDRRRVPGPAAGPHAKDRSGAGTLSGGRPGIGQADMSASARPPEAARGRSRAKSRAAFRKGRPRESGPEKGRGPSTHEMEGPTRSSSAGHRYLMLSVRATRSTTKPDTRSKSQLPSSSCVPGCPPDGFRFRQ